MDVILTGFSKKLLVAISLIVIIAMCITPNEARSLEEQSINKFLPQTKEISKLSRRHAAEPHRLRHGKKLDSPTIPSRTYVTEMRKIIQKVKNTRSHFKDERKQLKFDFKPRDYKPDYIPRVNFVDIHYHDYNSRAANRTGRSGPEKRFNYIIQKLYKSLSEYHEIIQRFQMMELHIPDTPVNSYKNIRYTLLQNTTGRLYSTIQDIKDSMFVLKIKSAPETKLDLSSLSLNVKDTSQCQENDYATLRAYGNLLDNWYLEFRCPRNGKNSRKKICTDWEHRLKAKDANRKKNKDGRRRTGRPTGRQTGRPTGRPS